MKRKITFGFLTIMLGVLIAGALYLNSLMPIITGYAAKNLASAVFVSGRSQADVEALDLNFSFIKYTSNTVDNELNKVTSRFLWGKSVAIYRKGFGCTLVREIDEDSLRSIKFPEMVPVNYAQDTTPWPLGNVLPDTSTGIDLLKLEQIAMALMDEHAYGGHAFSFLVLHKGFPVVEKYNPGINENTRLLSWSMAKSFTSALAGIMQMDRKWDINTPAAIEAWQGDKRKNITISNLLQMQSGLEWNEDYGNRSDVTVMLHDKADFARFAYEKTIKHDPATYWYYSSGTTNIVNHLMREAIGDDNEYYQFAANRLFNKIGMPDAVFEVDASGTQVGSSYIYATTRDYARFALLYLQDGVFNGERILPEGWVDYTRAIVPNTKGAYGAGFWLNHRKDLPAAPASMYRCQGHDGQRIFILPDQGMAIVVLGYSPKKTNDMDFNRLIGDVLKAIEP
ncbi:MAG: serine hydrolase [Lentimicrobium sp.]|jgi:CubicO group peptidase (beta-lactamase class C family)|nr:serine hydrolase [Lentimicrobium sp.]